LALERWAPYCERNWLNDSGDVFSPEMKVKRFLDSLAYILLAGNRDGIETDYRRVMHAKREIPESSCPSYVRNIMYGSGSVSKNVAIEEKAQFNALTEILDLAAEKYETPQKPSKTESLFQKRNRLGIHGGTWCRVDTAGQFRIGNEVYKISDQAIPYQPIQTEYGEYYPMDRILACDGKFYDMNLDEVEVYPVGGWIAAEDHPWWNEMH